MAFLVGSLVARLPDGASHGLRDRGGTHLVRCSDLLGIPHDQLECFIAEASIVSETAGVGRSSGPSRQPRTTTRSPARRERRATTTPGSWSSMSSGRALASRSPAMLILTSAATYLGESVPSTSRYNLLAELLVDRRSSGIDRVLGLFSVPPKQRWC